MPDKRIIDFNAAVARIVTKDGVFEGAPPNSPVLASKSLKRAQFASNDDLGDSCQCGQCKPNKIVPFPGAPA